MTKIIFDKKIEKIPCISSIYNNATQYLSIKKSFSPLSLQSYKIIIIIQRKFAKR